LVSVNQFDVASTSYTIHRDTANGYYYVYVFYADNSVLTMPTSINDKSSGFLILRREGTSLKLFLNAIEVGSTTITKTVRTFDKISIARSYQGYAVAGYVDEVRVYNMSLSQNEISENFATNSDASSIFNAKLTKGTTQIMVTLSWQGTGSLNATINSLSRSYTEDTLPIYQKTVYSSSSGSLNMMNIKRLSISTTALSSDENWQIILNKSNVGEFTIAVEIDK
jgi:hypothetical protein